MKITILGWYGTETIGDRAILAGIVRVLSENISAYSICIGSLHPILTERTLFDDHVFLYSCSKQKMTSVSVFNSMDVNELKSNVRHSDLVLIGGGPLMDLYEMYMLEYAFIIAKKHSIPTFVCGCGWGPLKAPEFIKVANYLVDNSTVTVFRDEISYGQYQKAGGKPSNKVSYAIDPAVFACCEFKSQYHFEQKNNYIAVNFRDVAIERTHYPNLKDEKVFYNVLSDVLDKTGLSVELIPMHTFEIGGDDRCFLDKLAKQIDNSRIISIQQPLSLFQTMEKYYHASVCIGMRFHSVVLQTILNGKNFVFDYTDPQTGKTIGFLRQLDIVKLYKNQYYSLSKLNKLDIGFDLSDINEYVFPTEKNNKYLRIYSQALKKVLE